jgi:DNA polymerase III delta subunit
LRDYLDNPSPTTTLVLVHGPGQSAEAAFANAGVHIAAEVPKGDALRTWVTDRAIAVGIALEDEAADFLIASVGASPSHLAVELQKLAAAAVTDAPISVEVVEQYVGVRRGETVTDWVDAVMQRDTARAVSLLDIVLPQPGVSGVRMLMTLGTELIGTRLARALRDAGRPPRAVGSALFESLKASRPMGLGPWGAVVERWSTHTRSWTGPQLDDAIRAVYEADQQLKNTTLSDERDTISTMVLQLSATREAA